MMALVTIETVLIALLAILVIGLLRSHAEILSKLHELGAGVGSGDTDPVVNVPAPQRLDRGGRTGASVERLTPVDISGVTVGGDAIAVGVTGSTHRTLLAFLSSGCSTCSGFWKAFRLEGGVLGGSVVPGLGGARLVIVTRDPSEESITALGNLVPSKTVVVMSTKAWSDYAVPASPYFVFVDGPSSSIVGEGTAATWDQVQRLVSLSFADEGGANGATRKTMPGARMQAPGDPPNSLSGPERELRNDMELARAGILPGDPSLYAKDIGEVFPNV